MRQFCCLAARPAVWKLAGDGDPVFAAAAGNIGDAAMGEDKPCIGACLGQFGGNRELAGEKTHVEGKTARIAYPALASGGCPIMLAFCCAMA